MERSQTAKINTRDVIGVPLAVQACDILHFVDRHEFEIPSLQVYPCLNKQGLYYCSDLFVWIQHYLKTGLLLMKFIVVFALGVLECLCVSGSHSIACGSLISCRNSKMWAWWYEAGGCAAELARFGNLA